MLRLGKILKIAYAGGAMHDVISDEELMLQYKRGDNLAFESLYARYRTPLFRYLQHQCGNLATAEELYQDIWLSLIRTRQRYEVRASLKTFIYRLAHNRLIDHYRRQKHGIPVSYEEQEALLNLESPQESIPAERRLDSARQLAQLNIAICGLPEAQREAFLLKENADMSVEQIAEVTGVNPETAKSRIRYAVNKLRQTLDLADDE